MASTKVRVVVLSKAKKSGLALFNALDTRVRGSRSREDLRVQDVVELLEKTIAEAGADPIKVKPDDTLCWESEGDEFAIVFTGESPFKGNQKVIPSHNGVTECLPVKHHGHGKKKPRVKRFHYAVTLAKGREVLTLDPEVIIEDGC